MDVEFCSEHRDILKNWIDFLVISWINNTFFVSKSLFCHLKSAMITTPLLFCCDLFNFNDVTFCGTNKIHVTKLSFENLNLPNWSEVHVKNLFTVSSVIRTFFLKNTDVGPKKHEKHQKKSQKTREKHEFFAKISKNLTHPTFFIAFLCINIFKVEKIGNFFQKNV